ncbi:hypothetical protein DET65_1549 [Sunxiuqinia elliptica]|uniref:Uncharacterized protein n=1 Tax=Sunxiuqinia elliptica TaxID=655355 RepID=A0A4R6HC71_9BACT|nr:hypothetical protein DET52_101991 [Sunxiuqinia elliptica]TDO65171.1 hypothetical protein DET65_1549 [Sunxiuqinia elliptica]
MAGTILFYNLTKPISMKKITYLFEKLTLQMYREL